MPDRPDLLARLTLVPTLCDTVEDRSFATGAAVAIPDAARIHPGKFRVPGTAASHLLRVDLLDRMDNAHTAQLILVEAAAGFGKTTLLRQYRER